VTACCPGEPWYATAVAWLGVGGAIALVLWPCVWLANELVGCA
jgi:hypothetical protein